MAIYSRRILHRLINENAQFLLKGQINKHVQELDRMSQNSSLAYEWEVVILNALRKVGKVEHERKFPGSSKRIDIYFETSDQPKKNFIADITAISDQGMDKANPYSALSKELRKLVKGYKLNPNSFNLHVGKYVDPAIKRRSKIKLKLPGRARFSQTIFTTKFEAFIHRILENPQDTNQYKVKTDDADVEITYIPDQKYAIGGYASYTEIYSKSDNTAYQALESKAAQLRKADFKGPLGIFLCDGGSSLFNKTYSTGLSYTIDEVIQYFLSNHEEIYFIATFTTGREKPYVNFPNVNNPYINNVRFYRGVKLNQVDFNIEEILMTMAERLPVPEIDPRNAINLLKSRNPDIGRSKWGGWELSENGTKVKISARALLELLAGKVDQREFYEAHRFVKSEKWKRDAKNPFNDALDKGLLIYSVSAEKSENEDDDWVTFELKGPDPAISPFIALFKDK